MDDLIEVKPKPGMLFTFNGLAQAVLDPDGDRMVVGVAGAFALKYIYFKDNYIHSMPARLFKEMGNLRDLEQGTRVRFDPNNDRYVVDSEGDLVVIRQHDQVSCPHYYLYDRSTHSLYTTAATKVIQ